jgi:hypothetical protein
MLEITAEQQRGHAENPSFVDNVRPSVMHALFPTPDICGGNHPQMPREFAKLHASSSLLYPKTSSYKSLHQERPPLVSCLRDVDIRLEVRLDVRLDAVLMPSSVDVDASFATAGY